MRLIVFSAFLAAVARCLHELPDSADGPGSKGHERYQRDNHGRGAADPLDTVHASELEDRNVGKSVRRDNSDEAVQQNGNVQKPASRSSPHEAVQQNGHVQKPAKRSRPDEAVQQNGNVQKPARRNRPDEAVQQNGIVQKPARRNRPDEVTETSAAELQAVRENEIVQQPARRTNRREAVRENENVQQPARTTNRREAVRENGNVQQPTRRTNRKEAVGENENVQQPASFTNRREAVWETEDVQQPPRRTNRGEAVRENENVQQPPRRTNRREAEKRGKNDPASPAKKKKSSGRGHVQREPLVVTEIRARAKPTPSSPRRSHASREKTEQKQGHKGTMQEHPQRVVHREHGSPEKTQNFALVGSGYCAFGYYAGWNAAEADSVTSCAKVCARERQCRFFSFSLGKTCSRYNGTCAHPRKGAQNQAVYRKVSQGSVAHASTASKKEAEEAPIPDVVEVLGSPRSFDKDEVVQQKQNVQKSDRNHNSDEKQARRTSPKKVRRDPRKRSHRDRNAQKKTPPSAVAKHAKRREQKQGRRKLDGPGKIVFVHTRPQPADSQHRQHQSAPAAPSRDSTSQTLPTSDHQRLQQKVTGDIKHAIKPVHLPERASPSHRRNRASTVEPLDSRSVMSPHKTQATSPVEERVGVRRSSVRVHAFSHTRQQEHATRRPPRRRRPQSRRRPQPYIMRAPKRKKPKIRTKRFTKAPTPRRTPKQPKNQSKSSHAPCREQPIVQIIVNHPNHQKVTSTVPPKRPVAMPERTASTRSKAIRAPPPPSPRPATVAGGL